MVLKTCKDCGEGKSINEFYYNRTYGNTMSYCKSCASKRDAIKRAMHPQRQKEINTEWRRRNPDMAAAKTRRDREKNPEKYKARNILQHAIASGKIIRGVCEVCGVANSHGHHDDYSKPLGVRWLCATHHRKFHATKQLTTS